MAETWFNRPMEYSDIQEGESFIAPACCCKREFYSHGFEWFCAQHGNTNEAEYVDRAGLDGLVGACPCCDSYRVAHDFVSGARECLNCFETWEVD